MKPLFPFTGLGPGGALCFLPLALLMAFGCGRYGATQGDQTAQKVLASGQVNVLSEAEKKQGWKLLFDGRTTSGWRGVNQQAFPARGWKVADGLLLVHAEDAAEPGTGGDIITTRQYGNFDLVWEWKMLTKGGNSGLKYFVQEGLGDKKNGIGPEYQILDDENFPWMQQGRMKPGDYHTLAALYELYPAEKKSSRPLGQWNQSRILVQGRHVEHWLNGQKVLEYERGSADFRKRVAASKFKAFENFGEAAQGHILLQDHGSKMAFRNIKIREGK